MGHARDESDGGVLPRIDPIVQQLSKFVKYSNGRDRSVLTHPDADN